MSKRFNNRGQTPSELRWPETPEFTSVMAQYQAAAVRTMLEAVWTGYDLLVAEILSQIDITHATEDIERSITKHLPERIRKSLTGFEPFYVEKEETEEETRKPPPAQPPMYDIAFILTANPRVMWPLEAKVLKTPKAIAPYTKEIQDNYLSGRYAPFSKSGAMLGYLLSGQAHQAAKNIEKKLGCQLKPYRFNNPVQRPHYVSRHDRQLPNPTLASGEFECHHLIMAMKV